MEERHSGDFDYEVAISFAGEDRGVAERIAGLLKDSGITVFYDNYEEADLWGKDLYERLADIYSNKARYCLVLISSHYSNKLWTMHELRNAFVRAFQENEEYILPLKLDDTTIPGIRKTIGYQDLRTSSVEKIVELIKAKLGKPSGGKDDQESKDRTRPSGHVPSVPLPPIKRQFSDRDKSLFLKDSFEKTVNYFKAGLLALSQHDPTIDTEVTEVTSQKYVFEIYRSGERKNACKIWIGTLGSQKNISYREGDFDSHDDSSVNEWIYVESDDRGMYLKGIMGEFGNRLYGSKLSVEDAATILWERFIRPLSY